MVSIETFVVVMLIAVSTSFVGGYFFAYFCHCFGLRHTRRAQKFYLNLFYGRFGESDKDGKNGSS